jgi:transcriptional regulator with XRE-family HTH domain
MRDLELGRLVRTLRRRRGWRQVDCASRASVHRSTWSLWERGHVDRMSLAVLRACLDVLEIRLDLVPRWRGADLDRLRDEAHAGLEAAWKRRLERWGWQVSAEVSFNHYGDRGRVDLLAWHAVNRLLLVVEVRSEVADVQALLGALDVKIRVAPPCLGARDSTECRLRIAKRG